MMRIFWGKRSGQYELSQDIYVLAVYVGDIQLVQCTLNVDSTAADCLDYLRHKLEFRQSEVFGLRYQMRCNDPDNRMWRWVEAEKPLRKQLDKYACKPRQVHLGILFHTPNIFALQDDMARSLYYTLLKTKVLGGVYLIEIDKYVKLAALSLQVEFGDYEPTVHSLDFLRAQMLLPGALSRSIPFLDDFLLRILTAYERHCGKDASIAAIEYIVEVMQADNYGEELFTAKDDESTEVRVGYRLDGVIVKRFNGKTLLYKFDEIKEFTTSKRNVTVKCFDGTNAVFSLENADMATYVCHLLRWQFKFAMTDAVMHKSVPHTIYNPNGSGRTFGAVNSRALPRMTSVEPPSTRTTNSLDMGASICSSDPPCSSNSLLARAISNPFVNHSSLQGSTSINAAALGSSMNMPPSVSTPSIPHHFVAAPAAIQTPFEMRDVEHRILRQLLSEKRAARKIGSSPEIHTINARYTSHASNIGRTTALSGVGRRLNLNGRNSGMGTTSLSTPDLFLKCASTPNLGPFSQGRVVSSASGTRAPGQCITYPVPLPSNPGSTHVLHVGNGIPPPPLENLQSILARLRPPIESPMNLSPCDTTRTQSIDENYSPVSTPSSAGLPDRPPLSFDSDTPDSFTKMPPASAASRHVLLNGVILNDRPDFLDPRHCHGFGSENATDIAYRLTDDTTKLFGYKLSNPSMIDMEFAGIPQKRLSAGASTSQNAENVKRNRPKAVLPYEDTRVMLHPTRKNTDGYINASNVQVPIGDKLFRYVLTQAPMKQTLEDFWQMIWESGARIVVAMNSRPDEAGIIYWPTHTGSKLSIGDYSIRHSHTTVTRSLITTILTVKSLSSGEKRTIYRLDFTGFGREEGVPANTEVFLDFIDAVNSVKRHIENEIQRDADSGVFVNSSRNNSRSRSRSTNRSSLLDVTNKLRSHSVEHNSSLWRRKLQPRGAQLSSTSSSTHSDASTGSSSNDAHSRPNGTGFRLDVTLDAQPAILVHCSDGSGDSGVFVLVEAIIHCIENNVAVDVGKLLKLLRHQRACLVRSPGQYRFVYESVLAYLQRSRLI
uniref:protein-tyrosine-phosphatase n=1 Tax=Panagrellus redivivus TaxID=6233 RepID=A0A7E4UZI0_PANRE